MSGNNNTEQEAGGGDILSHSFYIAGFAVASVVGLWWDNRKDKKKIQELEFKIIKSNKDIQDLNVTIKKCNKDIQDLEVKIKKCKLDVLENLLVERQHLFCSNFVPKSQRILVEKEIRENARDLISGMVIKKGDLEKIFREDVQCDLSLSYMWLRDKRRNGGLMWKMLDDWREAAGKSS